MFDRPSDPMLRTANGEAETRPMIHVRHGPSAPSPPPAAPSMRTRLRAAGIHLGLSVVVAAAVLCVVLFTWYPMPMPSLIGVGAILAIMLVVDVTLGPLFTLIVFDPRKRSLRWDLATIAALQLAALVYGLATVYQGRPAFVVYVKDRFEIVSPAELRSGERAAARSNPAATIDPWGIRWVSARLPESAEERSTILFEALTHGRDVQHHPRLFVPFESDATAAIERALPIERLRALNPGAGAEIDAAIASTGRPQEAVRFLPLRAPARDGAVLLAHPEGRVLKVVALTPW